MNWPITTIKKYCNNYWKIQVLTERQLMNRYETHPGPGPGPLGGRSGQGAAVAVGMLRGAGDARTWKIVGFRGILVSWFLGCWVFGFLVLLFLGFLVSWVLGFLVSWVVVLGELVSKFLRCEDSKNLEYFQKLFVTYYKIPLHVFYKYCSHIKDAQDFC